MQDMVMSIIEKKRRKPIVDGIVGLGVTGGQVASEIVEENAILSMRVIIVIVDSNVVGYAIYFLLHNTI